MTDNEAWRAGRACRDIPVSVFFPHDDIGVRVAAEICRACPVQVECLEYALAERIEYGVWGGASERERKRIRRRRRDQARRVA